MCGGLPKVMQVEMKLGLGAQNPGLSLFSVSSSCWG